MSSEPAVAPKAAVRPPGAAVAAAPASLPAVPARPTPPAPASLGEVVIQIADVGKCYHIYDKPSHRLKQAIRRRSKLYREFWALRDISLDIHRGESIGIVGRNGSGKSTLMQIVSGVLTPTTGTVTLAGRVSALLELGSGFNLDFTGRENAYLYGSILGLTRPQVDAKFDDIASFADIGAFMDQPMRTYSSGMKMRIAFAVQVQLEPEILVIDEALAVGDNLFQKRCKQRLAALCDKGVTLLFVSHQEEAIRTMTSRCLLLHQGRARAVGKPADVLLEYRRLLHQEERNWHTGQAQALKQAAQPSTTSSAAPKTAAPAKAFGDFDAHIESVKVFDESGRPCGQFYPGERLTIRIAARIGKPLTNLNIGLRLRNKEGVKVYSWGTLNQDISIWSGRPEAPSDAEPFWERSFEAGELVEVDFTCDCRLGAGFYEVQALIAEEKDRFYAAERMLHWQDEAAFFTVALAKEQYYFGGVTDLMMQAHVKTSEPT